MSNRTYDRVRSWIAIAGLVLGIFAVGLSFHTNAESNDRTQSALDTFTATSCERQHATADQWDSVLAVLTDIAEKSSPGSSQSSQFQELVTRTHDIYSVFPACKGLTYDPVTKKATKS